MPATTRTESRHGLPDQRGERCPQPACPEHVERVGGWTIDRSRTSLETLAADAAHSAPFGGPDLPEGSRSIRRDDRTVLKTTRRTCIHRLFTAVDHNCGKHGARFHTIPTRSARPFDEMCQASGSRKALHAPWRTGGGCGKLEREVAGRAACHFRNGRGRRDREARAEVIGGRGSAPEPAPASPTVSVPSP